MFFVSFILGAIIGGQVGGLFTNGESVVHDDLTQLASAFLGSIIAVIIYSQVAIYFITN